MLPHIFLLAYIESLVDFLSYLHAPNFLKRVYHKVNIPSVEGLASSFSDSQLTQSTHRDFTRDGKTVLLCVLVKAEVSKLKKIVKRNDPHSFVTVISTQNVIGRFIQVW